MFNKTNLVSIYDVSDKLRVPDTSIYSLIKSGILPAPTHQLPAKNKARYYTPDEAMAVVGKFKTYRRLAKERKKLYEELKSIKEEIDALKINGGTNE